MYYVQPPKPDYVWVGENDWRMTVCAMCYTDVWYKVSDFLSISRLSLSVVSGTYQQGHL